MSDRRELERLAYEALCDVACHGRIICVPGKPCLPCRIHAHRVRELRSTHWTWVASEVQRLTALGVGEASE